MTIDNTSMKISGAYTARLESPVAICSFGAALRSMALEAAYGEIVKDAANWLSHLTEYLPYLKGADPAKYTDALRSSVKLLLHDGTSPREKKCEEILKSRAPIRAAVEITSAQWLDHLENSGRFKRTKASLYITAIPERIDRNGRGNMIIMPKGPIIEDLLLESTMRKGTSDIGDLALNYGISNFSFNGAKPDPESAKISDWNARREIWRSVAEIDPPSTELSILDAGKIKRFLDKKQRIADGDELSAVEQDIIKTIAGADKRLGAYAYKIAYAEYAKRNRRMTFADIARAFDAELRISGSDAADLLSAAKDRLRGYMIDYSRADNIDAATIPESIRLEEAVR